MRALFLAGLALAAACDPMPKARWMVLETSKGVIVAKLDAERAPKTVAHLTMLANRHYFDGMIFHRVVPGFLIQTGDATGTGKGDPKIPVDDELKGAKFDKPGLLGMASWGPGTSQTQFFITLGPGPDLDGLHTRFGEVTKGLDVAKRLAEGPRITTDGLDRPLDPPKLVRLSVVSQPPP